MLKVIGIETIAAVAAQDGKESSQWERQSIAAKKAPAMSASWRQIFARKVTMPGGASSFPGPTRKIGLWSIENGKREKR